MKKIKKHEKHLLVEKLLAKAIKLAKEGGI